MSCFFSVGLVVPGDGDSWTLGRGSERPGFKERIKS